MIEWSETERMVQDAVRRFVDAEIRPNVEALEHGTLPPYAILRKMFATFGVEAMAEDAVAKLLAADDAPREARSTPRAKDASSGLGAQISFAMIAATELCRVCPGMVGALGVSLGLAAGTIAARGTRDQKARWLGDLVTLRKVGAWAITEPNAGSDAFGGMTTTVRRDGEGYRLTGQKTFITNGPHADTLVVYAKLDDGRSDVRSRRVLTFVLDRGMPGLVQTPALRKMGFHSSPTGELFFDDVYLEPDRLLGAPSGPEDEGRASARASFTMERFGLAAMALGVIEECLALSVDYAKKRELWGTSIGSFQLIQLKLARMEVARVNVQNMVFRAVELARAGRAMSLAEASAIKLYASEAANEVATEAVQLFGGNGYMAEYRVEQLARDARSFTLYAGSNEVQVTHIAKDLLRR